MQRTSISWVLGPDGSQGFSWQPFAGCKPISKGCAHCYAARLAATRLTHLPAYAGLAKSVPLHDTRGQIWTHEARWTGEVRFFADKLAEPLRRRKPTGVFVGDMGDIGLLTNEQIAAVFGVMAACPQHRFFVLTKRPGRLREWFEWMSSNNLYSVLFYAAIEHCDGETADRKLNEAFSFVPGRESLVRWPLPNVWVGTSVCTQDDAEKNIPELLRIPAAVRFLSCEPLLDDIGIGRWIGPSLHMRSVTSPSGYLTGLEETGRSRGIHWIIAGGESGPRARPCRVEWIRSLVRQCREAGVATWVKQLGARPTGENWGPGKLPLLGTAPRHFERDTWILRDRAGSDMAEFPADLRVRKLPERAP